MGPRPRRYTPRTPSPLPASLHERNTAPAGQPTAWLTPVVKEISPLVAQNEQNTALFSVPGRRIFHGTPPPFTQGRFFFHLNPPYPTGGTKLALLGPISAQAGNNSPSTLKTPQNWRFYACWANFFAEMLLKGPCGASFFAPIGPAPRSCRRRGARGWLRWGFCSIRSWLAACRRRVVPLMTPFPPFGGGPADPPPGGLTCA